jgi:hypothetical protein
LKKPFKDGGKPAHAQTPPLLIKKSKWGEQNGPNEITSPNAFSLNYLKYLESLRVSANWGF